MSDEIIKVLDELGKKFGVAIDWTQQNVTPYIQDLGNRIIKYEIATSIVWLVISLLLIGLSVLLCYLSYKRKWDECIEFILIPITIILFLGCGITIVVQIFDIIKCNTIPETIWLQYIQNYIN